MPVQVTINGTEYWSYVSVATVDTYANASLTADAWQAMVEDDKSRVVVSVTRWIDSQCWKGDPISDAQPLAFPRTVGDIAVIEQVAVLLSVLVAANPELIDQLTGAVPPSADGGTRRLKAGSVEIEYFRARNFAIYGEGIAPFPRNVMGLIGQWLCGRVTSAWAASGSSSYGTGAPSVVGRRGRFGFVRPI